MTKEERLRKLEDRYNEMHGFDLEFLKEYRFTGGVDEVGRGPLAGPVVTACVVLPPEFKVLGIDDSKKVPQKKREELFDIITENCTAYGIGICDNRIIDEINILEATKRAMTEAINKADESLKLKGLGSLGHVLTDAVRLKDLSVGQTNIIKGDATSLAIAAASIVAKVTRDRMMVEYAKEYPWYGFESNKGYGTRVHYEGIAAHGITPIHRKSFLKGVNYEDHSKY